MVQCAHNKNIPIVWCRPFKNKRTKKSNSPILTNSTELLSASSDKLCCMRTCSLVILRFIPRRHIQMKAILTIKFVQLHQAAFITWGHSRKLMQHRVWICNAEQRWVWLLFFWVFFGRCMNLPDRFGWADLPYAATSQSFGEIILPACQTEEFSTLQASKWMRTDWGTATKLVLCEGTLKCSVSDGWKIVWAGPSSYWYLICSSTLEKH